MTNHVSRGRISRQAEAVESFDELAPAPKHNSYRPRTARLVSTKTAPIPVQDSADEHIIGKTARSGQQSSSMMRPKKRFHDESADDPDELTEVTNGEQTLRPKTGQTTGGGSPKVGAPSLSRKGDIKQTKWARKTDDDIAPAGVRIQAAVCEPNLRYNFMDEQPCFLRPTGTELRVFTQEGNEAEPCDWLKVTKRTKSLVYHPESNLVKINQAMDPSASIGRLMLLRFRSNTDASWVAKWARDSLGAKVIQEQDRYCCPMDMVRLRTTLTKCSHKLHSTWDTTNHKIGVVGSQPSTKRLSDEVSVLQPRATDGSPKANVARSVGALTSPPTSARTSLRHQMQISSQSPVTPRPQNDFSGGSAASGSRLLRSGRSTGQVQRLESPFVPAVRRWSVENTNWAKDWETPLIVRRTTVDKEDIPRLDEGECLNDNLIGYGLRYLFDKHERKAKDLHQRVYLHNSFFYEKLKGSRGSINYDGVKNWTAKVDLLAYDYIVVPVNEHYHWWVAIICNPGKLDPDPRELPAKTQGSINEHESTNGRVVSDVEMTDVTETRPSRSSEGLSTGKIDLVKSDIVDLIGDDKHPGTGHEPASTGRQTRKPRSGPKPLDPRDPRIITLDSLGGTHPQAIGHLKKYLLAEFEHKRHKVITETPPNLGMRARNIPEQNNLCDCGVYLLGYIQQFVENPDKFIELLLRKEKPNWDFDPSDLRQCWRTAIFAEKRGQRRKPSVQPGKRDSSTVESTPKQSRAPSCHTSRETSEINGVSDGRCEAEGKSSGRPSSSTKATESPTNPITLEADDSGYEPRHLSRTSDEQPHGPESMSSISPQATNHDNGEVLQSIEQDEPQIPAQNPPSTAESADDVVTVAEVRPKDVLPSPRRPKRAKNSTPAKGRHRAVQDRPPYTLSHFAAELSPDLEPVVEKAEVVRKPDSIDLTHHD